MTHSNLTEQAVLWVNFQCTARLLIHARTVTLQSIKLNGDKCGEDLFAGDVTPGEVMKNSSGKSFSSNHALVDWLCSRPVCVGEEKKQDGKKNKKTTTSHIRPMPQEVSVMFPSTTSACLFVWIFFWRSLRAVTQRRAEGDSWKPV